MNKSMDQINDKIKDLGKKRPFCLPEKISKMFLGVIFAAGAVALIISGITVFPIFGFLVAIPFAWLAIYFFRVHLNEKCEIESGDATKVE